jgi:hypothetical protein
MGQRHQIASNAKAEAEAEDAGAKPISQALQSQCFVPFAVSYLESRLTRQSSYLLCYCGDRSLL